MKSVYKLGSKDIKKLTMDLKYYRASLDLKTHKFIDKLSNVGIGICLEKAKKGDSHDFFEMVEFQKVFDGIGTVYIIGRNADLSKLHTRWYDSKGKPHDETISPILALEWGTAGKAIKGHRGDASVTGTHVNDEEWYYYAKLTSGGKPTERRYATAEEPHEPMYLCFVEMLTQIQKIAKEVFGNA